MRETKTKTTAKAKTHNLGKMNKYVDSAGLLWNKVLSKCTARAKQKQNKTKTKPKRNK